MTRVGSAAGIAPDAGVMAGSSAVACETGFDLTDDAGRRATDRPDIPSLRDRGTSSVSRDATQGRRPSRRGRSDCARHFAVQLMTAVGVARTISPSRLKAEDKSRNSGSPP